MSNETDEEVNENNVAASNIQTWQIALDLEGKNDIAVYNVTEKTYFTTPTQKSFLQCETFSLPDVGAEGVTLVQKSDGIFLLTTTAYQNLLSA